MPGDGLAGAPLNGPAIEDGEPNAGEGEDRRPGQIPDQEMQARQKAAFAPQGPAIGAMNEAGIRLGAPPHDPQHMRRRTIQNAGAIFSAVPFVRESLDKSEGKARTHPGIGARQIDLTKIAAKYRLP